MTGVHIAGTGMHPFGRHGDVTLAEMGAIAVRRALAEAGPDTRFQVAFCATAYGGVATGHRVRECGKLIDEGTTALGGRLPVNPSGGVLSKGEPLGASGLGQVVELARQLQGRCDPRQVDGARVGLAHTIGRGANASVTILTA